MIKNREYVSRKRSKKPIKWFDLVTRDGDYQHQLNFNKIDPIVLRKIWSRKFQYIIPTPSVLKKIL